MCLSISARRGVSAVAFLAASLVPQAAFACPMCFASSTGPVLRAFYLTAVGLTLLPLLIFGCIIAGIGYFRRRSIVSGKTTVTQDANAVETQSVDPGV
jgi:hypothetical protein